MVYMKMESVPFLNTSKRNEHPHGKTSHGHIKELNQPDNPPCQTESALCTHLVAYEPWYL